MASWAANGVSGEAWRLVNMEAYDVSRNDFVHAMGLCEKLQIEDYFHQL